MLPFLSTSKVGKSLISRRRGIRHAIKYASFNAEPWEYQNVRHVKCIAGVETSSIHRLFDKGQKIFPGSFHDISAIQRRRFIGCGDGEEGGVLSKQDHKISSGNLRDITAGQTRRFIGCGDGQEGGVLSKIYEERRVMGYSPEQLFDVVAAVDSYQDFVPWCQRSEVIKTYPDGSFDAELEIGFKFLVESYTSHVEIQRPKSVKTTVSQSTLFDHLINIWEFQPGPVPGTCNLYFLVDFKFQSPLYRQVASVFFKEVVSKLVGSFNDRCRLIYGPGVAVLENSYGQRA
ncbi:coenzyme Q-binding protein COQ10 homolog, mitochondrial-like [Cucurbita pepo subsp. pepo]|uniref:coenzyme Q-binding protein COQ10 homolog, mitochondrial-like n=1 Tax=Cucurbita pepo subsp. pepo TaxID=3664 RepID=UPI000C9D77B3|nr:coenzyme Q-binding protein COQ10 homolog, mitochondrial-like [Cucurbita pepo subsp. pepo]